MEAIQDVSWTILAVVIVYMIVIVGMSLYFSRRQSGMSDYYVAGRQIPFFVMAFSLTASTMSGWGFVGMPGLVYSHGWSIGACIGGGAATGMILSYFLLAKPMRFCSEKFGSLTVPDILEMRFNSKYVRAIAALAVFAGCVGYQSAQYKALANTLQAIFSIAYLPALFLGVFVLIFYTVLGGIKTVVWTDFLETSIMLVAAIFALVIGLHVCGGLTSANETLASVNPDFTKLIHETGPTTAIGVIGLFILLGLGYMGQPHVMTKFYTIEQKIQLKWAALFSIVSFLIVITAYYMGIWQKVLEIQGQVPALSDPDLAAPTFVRNYLPTLLSGVVFAGVLAAIFSTCGSFLIVASSAIVRDFIQQIILKRDMSRKEELRWSRGITILVILLTLSFTIRPVTLVGWLGVASWGLFAATLTPALVIGLWWRKATPKAAIVSTTIGLFGGLILFALKQFGIYTFSLDPLALTFVCSSFAMVIISLITKAQPNAYFKQ